MVVLLHEVVVVTKLMLATGVTGGPLGRHQWDVTLADLLGDSFLLVSASFRSFDHC